MRLLAVVLSACCLAGLALGALSWWATNLAQKITIGCHTTRAEWLPDGASCVDTAEVTTRSPSGHAQVAAYVRRHGSDFDLFVAMRSDTGHVSTVPLGRTADQLQFPEVHRLIDLNGDGVPEVLVQDSVGANITGYEVMSVLDDRIEAVRVGSSGEHLFLTTGGSVTHGSGYRCTDTDRDQHPELAKVGWSDVGDGADGNWTWTEGIYRWRTPQIVEPLRSLSGTAHASKDSQKGASFSGEACQIDKDAERLPPIAVSARQVVLLVLHAWQRNDLSTLTVYAGADEASPEQTAGGVTGALRAARELSFKEWKIALCDELPMIETYSNDAADSCLIAAPDGSIMTMRPTHGIGNDWEVGEVEGPFSSKVVGGPPRTRMSTLPTTLNQGGKVYRSRTDPFWVVAWQSDAHWSSAHFTAHGWRVISTGTGSTACRAEVPSSIQRELGGACTG